MANAYTAGLKDVRNWLFNVCPRRDLPAEISRGTNSTNKKQIVTEVSRKLKSLLKYNEVGFNSIVSISNLLIIKQPRTEI